MNESMSDRGQPKMDTVLVSGDAIGASRKAGAPILRSGWSHALRVFMRVCGGAILVLALVATIGATYEGIAGLGDAKTYLPNGRLVDVGGYRLHIDCRGEGSPTVVMDAGLGGASLDWSLVQPELATTTRVCTYDRAGMGWSDVSPQPRSPARIADELHALLRNADIRGPYVLVAHSLAGKSARMFAAAFPTEVAGMVLVDARSEYIDKAMSLADAEAFSSALRFQATTYSLVRRFGIARIFGAALVAGPSVSPALASEMFLLQTGSAAVEETVREGAARAEDDAALGRFTLGAMPLVVVAAAASIDTIRGWAKAQEGLAALSTNGRLVVAQHSSHYVQFDEPNLIIASVRDVLASVRQAP